MRKLALDALLSLAFGYVLAHFLVLFYNHWYFADDFWLKTSLLTLVLTAPLTVALQTPWRRLWIGLGIYWLLLHLINLITVKSFILRPLHFVQVLDFEAAMVWPSVLTVVIYAVVQELRAHWSQRRAAAASRRQLRLRSRLRRYDAQHARGGRMLMALLTAGVGLLLMAALPAQAEDSKTESDKAAKDSKTAPEKPASDSKAAPVSPAAEPPAPPSVFELEAQQRDNEDVITAEVLGAEDVPDDPEPELPIHDRHLEFFDQTLLPRTDGAHTRAQLLAYPGEPEALNWGAVGHLIKTPEWPDIYPVPLDLRERTHFEIVVQNWADGNISVSHDGQEEVVGHVLAPVAKTNPEGFTASGWAEPGRIAATAVNAIHIKTNHDYTTGRATIFSLVPKEFAEFDLAAYKSYFNSSSTLFTDIPGGSEIFGGQWAPLISSLVEILPRGGTDWQAMPLGWVPADGDSLRITVERRKYAPAWIEFENRYGGLIWIKEIGLDPYPIGQVLKPVVGCGRFTGTQYADLGRIRANHPGVIDISTAQMGVIGGFQIIPRDHSMSPEMTNARLLTQWMVVGPLYALDESWEGSEPLFNDYLYPCFTPAMKADGTVNEEIQGAAAFLDRFTVRGRYSDDPDPKKYVLLHPAEGKTDDAFKTLTHIRIFFPRT